jgi:hypothetical protein
MISSKQLYKTVSLNEYKQAKKTEIHALKYNYSFSRDVAKWDLIISRLAEKIPYTVSPSISRAQFINALNAFKQQRQAGNASLFNLSLHDCLDYFENFYFLYTTEDPRFKLNPAKKEKLLEAIFDAMGTCETGINTRFNMVMQLYRTDLDWVTNCLSQQRYQLVSALHDHFNAERHVGEAYQVHVLNIMLKEAKAAGMGVEVAHSVYDVYEHSIPNNSKSDVQAYFKHHAPRIFSEDYEAQILETLSQHLLFEINELYQPDAGISWDQQGRTLEDTEDTEDKKGEKQIAAFNKYIEDRLGFDSAGRELGDFNDDYTQFTLKPRAEFFELLKKFVQEKINREAYFLTLDNLNQYSLSDLKNFNIPHGVTAEALIEVNQAILACNAENLETIKTCRAALIKHAQVVLNFPDLVLERAKTNPVLLSNLPKVLTSDAYFLGQAVVTVDALLGQAEEAQNAEEVERLTWFLTSLVQHDPSYLKLCSTSIGNKLFMRKSFDYKGLFKQSTILQLKQNESLGFSQTARLAQKLTPDELIDVIQTRKKNNLSALPFCHDVSALNRWIAELGAEHMDIWNTGTLASLRSEACQRVRLGEEKSVNGGDSALTYLAKHELWFVAMARHQYAHTGQFKTLAQFWFVFKQWLMRLGEILGHLTLDILIFVCGVVLSAIVHLWIDLLLAMIPPLVLLVILVLLPTFFWLNQVLENRAFSRAAHAYMIIFACVFGLESMILSLTMMMIGHHVTTYIRPICHEFYTLSALIFTRVMAMFSSDEFAYTPDTTANEAMACDKIIADLAVGGDEHAVEKIDALIMLQYKIRSDRSDDEPGEHLNKRYTFFFHGEERALSFNEVVGMSPEDTCFLAVA